MLTLRISQESIKFQTICGFSHTKLTKILNDENKSI